MRIAVVVTTAILLLVSSVLLLVRVVDGAIPGGCPSGCSCQWPDLSGDNTLLQVFCSAFPNSLPDRANLTVRGSTVATLRTADLYKVRNAQSLHLVGLSIGSIEADNVQLADLRSLSLSGNHLSRIGNAAFRWCTRLESLDLSDNRIKNVSGRAFDGLGTLQHLSLAGNKLEDLEAASLPTTLTSLDLSRNLLHDTNRLPPTADGRQGRLIRLDLCGNDLRSFMVSPARTPNLGYLCVGDAVTDLRIDSADGLDTLRSLEVVGKTENGSESVLSAIVQFRNLHSLTLSHFDLNAVTLRLTEAFSQMARLRLKHVEAESGFAEGVLDALAPRLQLLDLEGSSALVKSLFDSTNGNSSGIVMSSLRSLSVAGTGITAIPVLFLSKTVPALNDLDLSGNPLHCDAASVLDILTAVMEGRLRLIGTNTTECAMPAAVAGLRLVDPRVVHRVMGEAGAIFHGTWTLQEFMDSLGVTRDHLFYVTLGLAVLVLVLLMALMIVCHMRRRRGARRDNGPARRGCCGSAGGSDESGEGFMMRADSEYTFDNFTLSDTLSESRRSAAASRESTLQNKTRKNSNRK